MGIAVQNSLKCTECFEGVLLTIKTIKYLKPLKSVHYFVFIEKLSSVWVFFPSTGYRLKFKHQMHPFNESTVQNIASEGMHFTASYSKGIKMQCAAL